MRADAQHDEPLGFLDAVGVGLGVAEGVDAASRLVADFERVGRVKSLRRDILNALSIFDFIFCSVTDEHWFTAPFDNHILALGDGSKIDFDFSLRQHVGGCRHVDEEI
jgi:hypothetical protein